MADHKLVDYLLRLACDPQESTLFRKSRESAMARMKAAGLSDTEQELLLSSDGAKISAAVGGSFAQEPGSTQVRMSVCFTAPAPGN